MTFIIIIALLVVGCVAYLVAGVQSNKKSLTPSNVEEAKKEVEVVEAEIETVVETVKPKAPKKATQKKVTKSK